MASFVTPNSFENFCPGHAKGPSGILITQLIQTLLAAHCNFNNPADYPKDYGDELKFGEEFDFVIVGAGSSGSVIANRLSKNSNWKILLLEAGGNPSFLSDIPGFLFSTHGTDIDWNYFSEKSTDSCLGMRDQRCAYPRGKVLGGSSVINAMLYVRGNPQDFDEWEKMGCEGWNYDNVLQYFKRSEYLNGYLLENEQFCEKNADLNGKVMSEKYHSSEGLLSVSPFADGAQGDIKNAVFEAVKELNYSALLDVNGQHQNGFTNVPGTLFQGTRANTAKMFLNQIKDRKNLKVVKNAVVQRLILKDKKIEGVEFVRNNITMKVTATKEIILSAGAISTPQLLLLSGIGPENHLKSVGIKPILNLQGVGENFQDHFVFMGVPFSILKSSSKSLPPLAKLDAMYMFLTKRESLLSSIGLTDLTGFVDTKDNSSVPDIQYIFFNFLKNDSYLLPEMIRAMSFADDFKRQYLEMVKESGMLMIGPTVLRPKSRGRIELKSADINDSPKIHAEVLKHPDDRETLLRGIKFLLKLMETSNFQRLEPELIRFQIEECDGLKFLSDEYWMCLMKYLTTSLYHPVGTCKMGKESDPFAVVDSQLRVHGMNGLRVCDASVMPTIVRGNTNAAAIMIGEKCSDMVKQSWENKLKTEL